MKVARLFHRWELKFHFSIEKVKRIEISVPDWADDTHLNHGGTGEWGTSDGKEKVVYYRGATKYEIPIPDCKRSVEVSCTPFKNPKTRDYNTNRKIIIDLYF